MRRGLVIAGVVVVLVAVGVVVYMRTSDGVGDDRAATSTKKETGKKYEQRAALSGPSPVDSRLRDGVKQVQDPAEALRMARGSLERVEKEIAAAQDETVRSNLVNKKKIIEGIIARLESDVR